MFLTDSSTPQKEITPQRQGICFGSGGRQGLKSSSAFPMHVQKVAAALMAAWDSGSGCKGRILKSNWGR